MSLSELRLLNQHLHEENRQLTLQRDRMRHANAISEESLRGSLKHLKIRTLTEDELSELETLRGKKKHVETLGQMLGVMMEMSGLSIKAIEEDRECVEELKREVASKEHKILSIEKNSEIQLVRLEKELETIMRKVTYKKEVNAKLEKANDVMRLEIEKYTDRLVDEDAKFKRHIHELESKVESLARQEHELKFIIDQSQRRRKQEEAAAECASNHDTWHVQCDGASRSLKDFTATFAEMLRQTTMRILRDAAETEEIQRRSILDAEAIQRRVLRTYAALNE